jgi:hypothetical protein
MMVGPIFGILWDLIFPLLIFYGWSPQQEEERADSISKKITVESQKLALLIAPKLVL